jgi:GT2 family glycosyltransferase/lipopolysaccharide/colanic/teichoic acid biosynthesis glycosyltransferase
MANPSDLTVKADTIEQPSPASEICLSVIIVNYNVKEFLEQTIISTRKALADIPSEIIVIDNASSDDSVTLVRTEFPEVRLHASDTNLGFARACNVGLDMARGEFLLLLNPDTIVQEDTFRKTLDYMRRHPDTGLLTCKILNPDGSLQLACRRSFPTPWVAFSRLSGLSHLLPKSKVFGRYNLTYLDPNATYEVEAISGSFMMTKREVVEQVGALDESFFMYGEDLDWCYRIGQAGWKIKYFPETQIIHFKGESSKRAPFDSLRAFYQAMQLFAQKHFRRRYTLMPYWLLWMAIWLRAGASLTSKFFEIIIVPVTDFALTFGSLSLAFWLRIGEFEKYRRAIPVLLAYSFVWFVVLQLSASHGRLRYSLSRAAGAVIFGLFINAGLTFFFNQYAYSRAVVLIGTCLILVILPGWRLLLRLLAATRLIRLRGLSGQPLRGRNTIIVGDPETSARIIKKFDNQAEPGYRVIGIVSAEAPGAVRLNGIRILGSPRDLDRIISQYGVEEVILSTKELGYDEILGIISRSEHSKVSFKLVPGNMDVVIGKATIDRIDDFPLLEINDKLHHARYRFSKRLFDQALALLALTLLMPLFLFKRHSKKFKAKKRTIYGLKNRPIELWEFDGQESRFNRLPWLFSILKGDLSFVGPEVMDIGGDSKPAERQNEFLRPGLTGFVQISRQKDMTLEEKKKYHLYYMKNYSPLLDLEILFKAWFKI